MVSKEKLVPRLKFGGFKKDEWILEKVSDLANTTYGGGTPTTSVIEYWKGDIPWISSSDLEENKVHNVTPSRYITKEAINISATKLVPKNSIAIVTRVGVGKLALVPFEYTASQDFLSISNINGNELYSVYALYKLLQIVKNETQGTSIKGITKDKLLDKNIYIPTNIEEQIKIGTFFKKIDEMIQLQQSKVNKVKDIKSAYLSEIFPKEGEKYPKKRFEGFTEPWNKNKLDTLANNYDTYRIPVTASDRIPGNTPYYGANGIQDYVEGYTHDGEYILLAEDGANDLKNYPVHYVNGKVWVNNHAHVLQGNPEVLDNRFLMYKLKTIDMEPYLVGGGRAKLNANVMMNIELVLPNLEEQIKIGSFFKNLDNQISIEKEKLAKLEKLKQAYLNDMFV